MRRRARAEVEPRLDAATERAGVSYRGLQIRGQRTRWASCSSSGAMSFNWRLLLAPREILDYVVEHEVAHLSVHDHSQRFWRLLGRRCPDYRAHERWLRDHGHTLRLYRTRPSSVGRARTRVITPSERSAPPGRRRRPSRPPGRRSRRAESGPPLHHRGREQVDRVLEGQHLRDAHQRGGQVVRRVEDARDQDGGEEDGVGVGGCGVEVRDGVGEGDAQRAEAGTPMAVTATSRTGSGGRATP